MTSFVKYDLVNYVLDSQNVLKCIFVNNFWHIEKGVEDFTLRGKVSDKCLYDIPLFFNELTVLGPCQNRQCYAFLREIIFVRRICRGASRHEMFLDDVDGGLGWILYSRLLKSNFSGVPGDR